MKKIRKFLCATVLSSAMMFSMCACGSDSGSTTAASGGGDNTEAATSAATEAKPSGGTINGDRIGDAFDDETADIRLAYVSHFSTCTEPGRFRKPKNRKWG